jgi:hypothetical protein
VPDDEVLEQLAVNDNPMKVSDVTALVRLFMDMLAGTKKDILDEYQRAWKQHAEQHNQSYEQARVDSERAHKELRSEIVSVREDLNEHLELATHRWQKEDEEDFVFDARVQPLKAVAWWLGKHWRDIVILLVGLLAILGFSTEWLSQFAN